MEIKIKVKYEKADKGDTPQRVVMEASGFPFYVFYRDRYWNYCFRKLDTTGKNFLKKLEEGEEPMRTAYFYFANYATAKKFVEKVVEELKLIKQKYETEVVDKEEEYIIQ